MKNIFLVALLVAVLTGAGCKNISANQTKEKTTVVNFPQNNDFQVTTTPVDDKKVEQTKSRPPKHWDRYTDLDFYGLVVGDSFPNGLVVKSVGDNIYFSGNVILKGNLYTEPLDIAYNAGDTCFNSIDSLPFHNNFCLSADQSKKLTKKEGRVKIEIKGFEIHMEGSPSADIIKIENEKEYLVDYNKIEKTASAWVNNWKKVMPDFAVNKFKKVSESKIKFEPQNIANPPYSVTDDPKIREIRKQFFVFDSPDKTKNVDLNIYRGFAFNNDGILRWSSDVDAVLLLTDLKNNKNQTLDQQGAFESRGFEEAVWLDNNHVAVVGSELVPDEEKVKNGQFDPSVLESYKECTKDFYASSPLLKVYDLSLGTVINYQYPDSSCKQLESVINNKVKEYNAKILNK